MDLGFWLGTLALVAYITLAMLEYVRMQTDQVKLGARIERLASERTENEKTLSNLGSEVQKYQSNTRYIDQAIQTFKLDLRGNTQANVVKVDAYGNVLRNHSRTAGAMFAETHP
jgi:cell division protein FtsL